MIFQQEVMVNLQIILLCKSHTATAENSLELISFYSLILDLVNVELKYNINSKMYSIKVI